MDDTTAHEDEPSHTDVRKSRTFVAVQLVLIGLLLALPARDDWPVPTALAFACGLGTVLGLAVMVVSATSLGRGLTAAPLPNVHAQLRTGGLYRFVRHPIYSGLLLTMTSVTACSGSGLRLLTLALLALLLNMKARWEESHLVQRFEGYANYAARTPRFVPVRLRR